MPPLRFPILSPLPVQVVGRFREELLPLLADTPLVPLPPEARETPALVISYGGDGTLLAAEREFPGIPKLPIRDRSHNPRCPHHGERSCLNEFLQGNTPARIFPKLQAIGPEGKTLLALNDLAIVRHLHPLGAIRIRIRQDGALLFPQVIADALIVATPYGATGYFQSITRGTFQQGLGLAFSNPVEGESFLVLRPDASLDVELLRGPALVQAGNNPQGFSLQEGEHLQVALSPKTATLYGLEAFRCRECQRLRQDGLPSPRP